MSTNSRVCFPGNDEYGNCWVEFSFNGLMYRHIDIICMGSPLGPTLPYIFIGYYERKLFKGSVGPKMYVIYMDDTFVRLRIRNVVTNS